MADRTIEVTLKLTTAQFKRAMEDAGDAAAKFGKETEAAGKQGTSFTRNMADVYQSLMAVKTGYESVTQMVGKFIAVGERAAQRQRSARMFETLSGGAAQAAENLRAMQKATRYTISEAEAMESAIGLLGMRLAQTPQELAQITQQVAALGGQFAGFSAERSIQQFMFAVENQSVQRLGEFGLNVSDVTRRVEELTAAGYEMREAFKVAVLEGLNEQFERIGGTTTDAATAFEQYQAAVKDLTAELEEIFLPTALRVVQSLRDMARLATGFYSEEFNLKFKASLEGTESAEDFVAQVRRGVELATSADGKSLGLQDYNALAVSVRETARSYEEYAAGMQEINAAIQRHNELNAKLQQAGAIPKPPIPEFEPSPEAWRRISAGRQREESRINAITARETAAAEQQAGIERAQAVMDAARKVVDIEAQMAADRRAIMDDFAQQAADRARQAGREAHIEALRAGFALEDAERQTAQRRAAIQQQYHQAQAQAAQQFARAQAQAAQQHAKRQEDIERQYQERLAAIQRQYAQDEFEATLNRDAAALFRARRKRDEDTAQAEQARATQQQQAGAQYQEALQSAQQAYNDSLAQAQQARAASLQQLEQALQEELAAKRRNEERARQEQALQLAWQEQDRQMFLQRRLAQVVGAYSAELQAASTFYAQLARMDNQYKASRTGGQTTATGAQKIPGVAPGSTPQAFATGGYTGGGLALLHAGEFVLNPQTTRQLEGAVGGQLTQQNVVQRGGVTVNASFTGMGNGDRAWFEARLQDFSRELAGVLQ